MHSFGSKIFLVSCNLWYRFTYVISDTNNTIRKKWKKCEKYFVLANFLLTGCVREINMFHVRKVFQHKHKSIVVNIPFKTTIWCSITSNKIYFLWIYYNIYIFMHYINPPQIFWSFLWSFMLFLFYNIVWDILLQSGQLIS